MNSKKQTKDNIKNNNISTTSVWITISSKPNNKTTVWKKNQQNNIGNINIDETTNWRNVQIKHLWE